MKKFITTIPLQPIGDRNLKMTRYSPVGNSRLQYDKATVFPVMYMLGGYVNEGEKAEILAIYHDYLASEDNLDTLQKNLDLLEKEVSAFSKERRAEVSVHPVSVEYSEEPLKHLDTFGKIIEHIEDGDELGACLTYGRKPTPIIEMMAINYALRAVRDCALLSVVYGAFDHVSEKSVVYEVKSLVDMDEIVRKIAEAGISNPIEYIQRTLEFVKE